VVTSLCQSLSHSWKGILLLPLRDRVAAAQEGGQEPQVHLGIMRKSSNCSLPDASHQRKRSVGEPVNFSSVLLPQHRQRWISLKQGLISVLKVH